MEQKAPDNVTQLKSTGMRFDGATDEQLAIINSLSSAEVDMLIGLKDRLNQADDISPDQEPTTGYFVW